MAWLWAFLRRIWTDEDAVVPVEYALLVVLVAVAAIALWSWFGLITRTKTAQASESLNGIH